MAKELSTTQEWVDIESAELPHFDMENMFNYFVERRVSDGAKANDSKNVKSHAYPLFKAGHIQSVLVSHKGNQYFIKSTCLPEMKKDIVYKLEMTLDHHGDIVTASCGCPAGGKPHGSCKHIAALCYALEAYCRLVEETRQDDSCTSRLQVWNHPRKRRLPPQEVEEIMFVKEEYGKSKRPMQPMVYDPRPTELQHTTTTEIEALRDALLATGKNVAFLHVLPLPNSIVSNSGKELNHHDTVIS